MQTKTTNEKKQNGVDGSLILRKYGLLIVLIIAFIILSIISDHFLTVSNLLNLTRQISVIGIMAAGMTLVIIAKGIDLSVGSIIALSAVIAASIIQINPSLVFVGIIVAILASSAAGGITGFMVAKLNVAPFIATLAMMTIIRGVALIYTDGRPTSLSNETFLFIGQGYVGAIPAPAIIFIVITVIIGIVLYKTKFGRYIYAVGGNLEAARASGINVNKVLLWVYILNGALAGLAGIVLASRISSAQPSIGFGYELDAIAAVVIGGTSLFGGVGTIMGTVLGVILIGIIDNALNLLNVSSYYQEVIMGVIIAAAVILDQKTKKGS